MRGNAEASHETHTPSVLIFPRQLFTWSGLTCAALEVLAYQLLRLAAKKPVEVIGTEARRNFNCLGVGVLRCPHRAHKYALVGGKIRLRRFIANAQKDRRLTLIVQNYSI
jgi:hypothetical protein